MVDVYIGVIGDPNSTIALEFDTFKEASDFCDTMAEHYKEEKKRLYLAIDNTNEFYNLEMMFKREPNKTGGIDEEVFAEILKLQEGREL